MSESRRLGTQRTRGANGSFISTQSSRARPVRRQADLEDGIFEPERRRDRRSRLRTALEHHDPCVVVPDAELLLAAEHPDRGDARDLSRLDAEATWEHGAQLREHHTVLRRRNVGRAADDLDLALSVEDGDERQLVLLGMRPRAAYLGDDDVLEAFSEPGDPLDLEPGARELVRDRLGARVDPGDLVQPADGRLHGSFLVPFEGPAQACDRKRMSFSYSIRMSRMPWRSIAMRSMPMPHANPENSVGSTPQCSNTVGWIIPQPSTSM
jgi:hypothetical protein